MCEGERVTKGNDLVPALVWKCCNGGADKGYGSKEAGDILSERWGKGMAHPGGA